MIKSIHHTAISVRDMKRSLHFYRDLLGMTMEWDFDPYPTNLALSKVVALKNPQVRVAMLSGFGHRIELFQYYKPKGKPYPKNFRVCDCGITHIALEVIDIEKHYEDLVRKGVKFNCSPQIVRNAAKVTYFQDPDGAVLEFIEYLKPLQK
jgi:catechol 2,3-dioxygenase-like lactoylglutathione lyase family enzyme